MIQNESPNWAPDSTKAIPARTHTHVTLAFFLLPPVAALLGWTLALRDVLAGTWDPRQRLWTRILVALVAVDSIVLVGWAWRRDDLERFDRLTANPAPPKARIGLDFEPGGAEAPARIRRVLPGLPADRAGLRPGDLIRKIDEQPAETQESAVESFRSNEPGKPRRFEIERDGSLRKIDVVPVAVGPVGLFQPLARAGGESWIRSLLQFLPAFLLGMLLWMFGRWRFRGAGSLWLAVLACLLGAPLVAVGAGRVVERILGAPSVGGWLVSLGVDSLALLGLARAAEAWLTAPPLDRRPGPVRVYFQGLFYVASIGSRVILLLMMADLLWFNGQGWSDELTQVVRGTRLGLGGNVLFMVAVGFLAPVAEEYFFRKFLLTRLLVQGGPVWAVAASAVLFTALHSRYGLYTPFILVYGAVFGWARIRTGGLAVPILLHSTVNMTTALMMLSQA